MYFQPKREEVELQKMTRLPIRTPLREQMKGVNGLNLDSAVTRHHDSSKKSGTIRMTDSDLRKPLPTGHVLPLSSRKSRPMMNKELIKKESDQEDSRVQHVSLEGGLLNDYILLTVEGICQQLNCVGCDGMGLAEAVEKKLPYGCSYQNRRRQRSGNFAIQEDRATPGTIDVRRPPGDEANEDGKPIVINLFAQWELGPAEKFDRVRPAPPDDSEATRQGWFRECLNAMSKLKLKSIAFPYKIGCGLAGGNWMEYEDMIQKFACDNPETEVIICEYLDCGRKAKAEVQTLR